MKSPLANTLPLSAGDGDDEWSEFGEAHPCDCQQIQVSNDVSSVQQWQWRRPGTESTFQACFPSLSPLRKTTLTRDRNRRSLFWNNLCQHSTTPNCVGQNDTILVRLRDAVLSPANVPTSQLTHTRSVDLPVDSEPFDWQQKEEIDLVPTFVRPGKPESPVDINFDHSQAAFGLSQLSGDDLKQMRWEMKEKVQHLSKVLVEELQSRDQLIHSLNIKNTFISSLLKVQSLRCHPSEEKPSTAKYLHSVIPFHPPDKGNWSNSILQQFTKILVAIAQNSDTVPDLVSDYIQSEVLKE